MGQLFRWKRPLKSLRLLQHFDRKLVRQMVLANDDLDIHAEIVRVAEDLHHPPGWALGRRRPARDLHIHHQAFQIVPFAAMHFFA